MLAYILYIYIYIYIYIIYIICTHTCRQGAASCTSTSNIHVYIHGYRQTDKEYHVSCSIHKHRSTCLWRDRQTDMIKRAYIPTYQYTDAARVPPANPTSRQITIISRCNTRHISQQDYTSSCANCSCTSCINVVGSRTHDLITVSFS